MAVAISFASACSSTVTRGDPRVETGLYVLYSYDGRTLPVTMTVSSCAPMITDGVLAVTPQQNATRPLYTLGVLARASCDELARVEPVLSDAGQWDDDLPTPTLLSAGGSVTGVLTGREAIVSASGHEYVFRFARAPGTPLESIKLSALEGSTPVDGTHFEITESDDIVARLNTANGGPHLSSALPGTLQVRVIPPLGYKLTAGQSNPSTYVLVAGTPLTIVVQLERSN